MQFVAHVIVEHSHICSFRTKFFAFFHCLCLVETIVYGRRRPTCRRTNHSQSVVFVWPFRDERIVCANPIFQLGNQWEVWTIRTKKKKKMKIQFRRSFGSVRILWRAKTWEIYRQFGQSSVKWCIFRRKCWTMASTNAAIASNRSNGLTYFIHIW